MLIDLAKLSPDAAYFALIQAVIPRPIAWVLSDNGDGSHNLAPFSFFTGITGEPPMILISIGHKPDGARKDTWVNIDERREFVVHIVPRGLAEPMVASSATLPHGDSEVKRLGLPTATVEGFRLPRLIGPKVAMMCTKYAIHEVGDGPQALILGEVKAIHVDDDAGSIRNGKIVIDANTVDPVSRLGGIDYAAFGEIFSIARPK